MLNATSHLAIDGQANWSDVVYKRLLWWSLKIINYVLYLPEIDTFFANRSSAISYFLTVSKPNWPWIIFWSISITWRMDVQSAEVQFLSYSPKITCLKTKKQLQWKIPKTRLSSYLGSDKRQLADVKTKTAKTLRV